jgi:DNA-binding transcriptional ArsR family regulator
VTDAPGPRIADISPATLKALGHPLRIQMLGVLRERPFTTSELADRLGVEARQITYHARKLEQLALVRQLPRTGRNSDRLYQLVALPRFSDQSWEDTPTVAKRVLAAAMVNQMHATALAAIPHGGFDRGNMHATRTSASVDEETWVALAKLMAETLARAEALCERGEEKVAAGASPVDATVQMFLFTTPWSHDGDTEAPDPTAGSTCEQALERAYQLWEELEPLLIGGEPAVAHAIAKLDELRVVLSAQREASRASLAAR